MLCALCLLHLCPDNGCTHRQTLAAALAWPSLPRLRRVSPADLLLLERGPRLAADTETKPSGCAQCGVIQATEELNEAMLMEDAARMGSAPEASLKIAFEGLKSQSIGNVRVAEPVESSIEPWPGTARVHTHVLPGMWLCR